MVVVLAGDGGVMVLVGSVVVEGSHRCSPISGSASATAAAAVMTSGD